MAKEAFYSLSPSNMLLFVVPVILSVCAFILETRQKTKIKNGRIYSSAAVEEEEGCEMCSDVHEETKDPTLPFIQHEYEAQLVSVAGRVG